MEEVFEIHFRDEKSAPDRSQVIAVSVRVEDYINMCLSRALGVMESKGTRSFGNTSRNLSFNAKLNLFLDLKGISRDEEKLLDKFGVVRNKFAHQLEVNTFYDCLVLDKDKAFKNFFENRYSSKVEQYEFNDNKVAEILPYFLDDVETVCGNVTKRMFDLIEEQIGALAKAKKMQFLLQNLTDFENMSTEEIAFFKRVWAMTKQQHKDYDFTDEVINLI